MRLNGLRRDEQPRGNLGVRETLRHQQEDVHLPARHAKPAHLRRHLGDCPGLIAVPARPPCAGCPGTPMRAGRGRWPRIRRRHRASSRPAAPSRPAALPGPPAAAQGDSTTARTAQSTRCLRPLARLLSRVTGPACQDGLRVSQAAAVPADRRAGGGSLLDRAPGVAVAGRLQQCGKAPGPAPRHQRRLGRRVKAPARAAARSGPACRTSTSQRRCPATARGTSSRNREATTATWPRLWSKTSGSPGMIASARAAACSAAWHRPDREHERLEADRHGLDPVRADLRRAALALPGRGQREVKVRCQGSRSSPAEGR